VFTNDFRMYNNKQEFGESITHIAYQIKGDTPPSVDDKSANNVFNAIKFYLSLNNHHGKTANGVKKILEGDVDCVLHNFIQKFQYPNIRTSECLLKSIELEIEMVPLRTILKLLYIEYKVTDGRGYITRDEILNFVFYNRNLVFNRNYQLKEILKAIRLYRKTEVFPDYITPKDFELLPRHFSNFIKILKYGGFVFESKNRLSLPIGRYSKRTKLQLAKILKDNSFLTCSRSITDDEYFGYMDIEITDSI
jgi:hypothetical protein